MNKPVSGNQPSGEEPINSESTGMKVRQASIDELVAVNAQIEEFITPYKKPVFEERLAGRQWLGLVAEADDTLLGFKLGYELEPGVFYSWLGGVLPNARGKGIARALLKEQEAWAIAQGYREIRVKSRNRYRAMLILLLNEGYSIWKLENEQSLPDTRIHFTKHFET